MKRITLKIRNIDYSIKDLESFINLKVIEEVRNYNLDPHCPPELWAGDPHFDFTENEKVAFIYIVNYRGGI